MNVLAMLQRVEEEEESLLDDELDSVNADGAMQPLRRRGEEKKVCQSSRTRHMICTTITSNSNSLMTDTLLVKVNE